MSLFDLIGPAQLAPLIGVTRQRVSFMLKNIERGDNKQRVDDALRKLAALIQKETDPE